MRKLPSLNGLRAFEAAARHSSFVGAAEELHVTQAAISRMVRLLEERMGLQLFERKPNELVLTVEGKTLQPGLTSAFDTIADLAEQTVSVRTQSTLTIGVGPSFAVRCLIPRITSFHERHPGIAVRVASGGAGHPCEDEWTCSIALGDGNWAGYDAEPLFSADLFPVCAPAVAARLTSPSALDNESLLEVAHSPDDWKLWLNAAGVRIKRRRHGPVFDNYAMSLQAAHDGLGVAMALTPYVERELANGDLVAPFSCTVPKARAWNLIYKAARRSNPAFLAFRAWLRETYANRLDGWNEDARARQGKLSALTAQTSLGR